MSRPAISLLLWVLAVVIAAGLGVFQRLTGPTYPERGRVEVGGETVGFRLLRTWAGAGDLEVSVGIARADVAGTVRWRRYPSDEQWRELAMERVGEALEAAIPHQPAAGKVEYEVLLELDGQVARLPSGGPLVARFRGQVPATILAPHILAMFLGMLLATRALLEVVRSGGGEPKWLVVAALVLLVLGGFVLGPIVQKHAFGAYWTGWPHGTDLTDNKTALAILAWLPAVVAVLRRRRTRLAVVLGWVVMMTVFLIPHSLRGSQIDWSEQAPPSASASP